MGISWVLAGLAGLALAFSMPGPDLGGLVWVALIPLFWALGDRDPKRAFQLGLVGGVVYFGALLYWLYTLWEWTSFALIPGYLVLVGYLGLYWGAFGALYAFLHRRLPLWALIPAVPALWVLLEYIRSLGKFGFSWGQIADALYRQLEMVQLVSITGPWGVSFLVVLVNLIIYQGIRRRRWRYPLVAALAAGLVFSWGGARLQQPLPQGEALAVSIAQPNIPQAIRSDTNRLDEFLAIYQRLLERIDRAAPHSDLVILPESILPAYVLSDPEVRGVFTGWTRTHETTMILGTYSREGDDVYNATVAISPAGDVVDTYHKNRLVPFSTEYFPGIGLVRQLGLSRWVPVGNRLGLITPGRGLKPLQTPWGPIGTPICFESIFSHITRKFVQSGAKLITTLTNDAWFKNTWALPQHFAKGVLRAVENGRYFVQAANTGVSGIVDPRGRIIERSPIQREAVLFGTVELLDGQTVYTRYGDGFVHLSLLYLAILFAWTARLAVIIRRGGGDVRISRARELRDGLG